MSVKVHGEEESKAAGDEEEGSGKNRKCDKKKKEAGVRVCVCARQESFHCDSKLMKRLVRCPLGLLGAIESSITVGMEIFSFFLSYMLVSKHTHTHTVAHRQMQASTGIIRITQENLHSPVRAHVSRHPDTAQTHTNYLLRRPCKQR